MILNFKQVRFKQQIDSWTANLKDIHWLMQERVAVIAILTLVVLIALFNVVGAIIMTLLEKKSNIKTLHQDRIRTWSAIRR